MRVAVLGAGLGGLSAACHLAGRARRFFRSGPFRTRDLDRGVPGLVLAGMGTVPGVGIPMVLFSGRLAADRAEA